jgi:oxygen-independent coproporphyrinogen-3 oxidase
VNGGPLAVYVHVPFCPSKCGYCDFNSFAMSGPVVERTVEATEADAARSPARGRPAKTVFFGGGTPTLLPPRLQARLLRSVLEAHPALAEAEVTTEANPGTVDEAGLGLLREAGFNRISLGAQSFRGPDLVQLGRAHGSLDVARAVRDARRAGFGRISLDLMFGLPGQTLAAWEDNVRQALDLGPGHLSLYCLTIEPNTRFFRYWSRGMLDLPEEGVQCAMYDRAVELCAGAGLAQYEISNFAWPGEECRHNLAYWRAEEYAGYGPGAVGCLRTGDGPYPRERTTRTKHPEAYCSHVESGSEAVCERETVDAATGERERIMLGIRLAEGLPCAGLPDEGIAKAVRRGWAVQAEGRVRLTPAGRHFCSEVAVGLI